MDLIKVIVAPWTFIKCPSNGEPACTIARLATETLVV